MPDFRWPWEPQAPDPNEPTLADFAASRNQTATGNSISAPPSQEFVLIPSKDPKNPTRVRNPNYTGDMLSVLDENGNPTGQYMPNPRAANAIKNQAAAAAKAAEPQVVAGRLYVPDPNSPTGWSARTPESPDDIKKLADIQQRQYNQALTGRYMTDEESLKYQADLQKLGNDKNAEARLQAEYEQKARAAEQEFKQKATLFPISVEQAGANVANTRATTANTQATTAATQAGTERTQALLPGEVTQQQLTAEGTRLSNEEARQKLEQGKAPTVATTPTGMYQWQRDPKTGTVTAVGMNPEYVPKTMPEVMARVGQINDAMQRKSAEVQAKVGQFIDGKQYTNDDALREYNQWHDQNVAPQAGAIQAAQQQALFDQAKQQADLRREAFNTALSAGTGYTNAANVEMQNRVGPGFQKAMNQIAAGQGRNVDLGSAIGYRAPSVTQGAADAVNNALKHISPGAAAAVGAPMPGFAGMDINAALAPTRYMQGGAPPPPPAPVAPVPGAGGMMGENPGWQRADQTWGGALPGNQLGNVLGKPGGWVDPNSPVFLGTMANMIPDFTYGGG